jgi:hypothetical protein
MAMQSTNTDNTLQARTEFLLAELGRVAERKSKLNRWCKPFFCICGFFYLGYGLLVILLRRLMPTVHTTPLTVVFYFALGVMSLSWMPEFIFRKRVKKDREHITALIKELSEDSRAIGAVAQLCSSTSFLSVADLALEPLLKLLPNVKAGDARYISDSQMEALLALLVVRIKDRSDERSRELPLMILKALEQIGDSRAREPVRRLTTGFNNLPYHQAARECLAVLEQQGEARDQDRFLLLPSSVEVGKETLLRPTIPQAELQPELLPRAATEKELG